jgi:peptidoglycan/LPS O-acetylase OafA/YrhL
MNALAMGALVAVLAERPDVRVPARPLAWATAVALVAIVVWRRGFDYSDVVVETAGFSLVALLFALWLLPIAGVAGRPDSLAARLPTAPWLRAVGRVSYGMYVVHYPLHWFTMNRLYPRLRGADGSISTPRLAAYVVVMGVVTYLLARISWTVLERPVLAFKRFAPPTGVRNPTIRIKTLSARGQ